MIQKLCHLKENEIKIMQDRKVKMTGVFIYIYIYIYVEYTCELTCVMGRREWPCFTVYENDTILYLQTALSVMHRQHG